MNSFILDQAHFNFRNKPDELDEFIYTAGWNNYKKHMNINN